MNTDKSKQEYKDLTIAKKLNDYIPNAQAIKYITLGALLPIMGYFIASLEIARYVISFLFTLAIFFYAGVVWGKNLFSKTLENAQDDWEDKLKTTQSASKKLVTQLLDFRKSPSQNSQKAIDDIGETLQPLQPVLKQGLILGAAFVTRIWAFSSLMGVLAFAVSLAICVATFMQVQLLDKQNTKLDIQNVLLEKQDSLLVEQNHLFKDQNTKVERQIDLMDEQNRFIGKQLVQIDTQNFFIGKQIEQGYVQNLLVQYQNRKIDVQTELIQHQNKRLDQQTYLQEAGRRSSLVFLFSNIMDAIDRDLKDDYGQDSIRNLSPQLIGRIIALSTRLKPYQYLEGDTLIGEYLSPERGQLLVSLVESQLDRISYGQIFKKAKFEFADLSEVNLVGANLKNANLRDANLRGTNLRDANLERANLRGANLERANLRGAKLRGTKLNNTNLYHANLYRSNLGYASLSDTDLSGVDLSGVDLKSANLRYANLRYANLSGANLRYADFTSADLRYADFTSADLTGADLRNANLIGTDFGQLDLDNVYRSFIDSIYANLSNVKTSEILFFEGLMKEKEEGIKDLKKDYFVDSIPKYNEWNKAKKNPYYLIKRKKN